MHPFPFLRHGGGVFQKCTLWVALEQPSPALVAALEALSLKVRAQGSVLVATGAELSSSEALDAALLDAPVTLAVRTEKVAGSDWHHESLARRERVLDALEALISGPYVQAPLRAGTARSVNQSLVQGLKEHLVPSFIRTALRVLVESASTQNAKAVIEDDLAERLPAWLDRVFMVDVVLCERLSLIRSIPPQLVEMSARFRAEEAKAVAEQHLAAHRFREEASRTEGGLDWRDLAAVKLAIAQSATLREVRQQFLDTNDAHIETLLALTTDERLKLGADVQFPTLMGNAAFRLMVPHGRFADALTLYDAAVEGQLDPMAASNPLFAVQDDNNHLGVDAKRARRYLERCVPHGPRNPAIFLNAACIAIELNEADQALTYLKQAKAHGFNIKQHKNERLFVPLRARAEFKALMR